MASTRKKKKAAITLTLLMQDGTTYKVVGEQGKFFLCEGGILFRKGNERIADVVVGKEETPNAE